MWTHHWAVCNCSDTFLEFSIEEFSQTVVLCQVLLGHLIQITAKDLGIELESERAEPYWQHQSIEITP